MAMAMAAAEPAVPGAAGERPQPNQVEMTPATLLRFAIVIVLGEIFRAYGVRDHIFLRCPIAQIDGTAPFAAERRLGISGLHLFLADRTLHSLFTLLQAS